MLLHANIDKAQENLGLVKEVFDLDLISDLFYDVLERKINTRSELRFKDESAIKRKESHFMTGSAEQEFGGKHATYYMVDDWVLDKNISTPEKNEKNIHAFHKLRWLNDHSGNFRIEMVGTHYYDDSIYCWLTNHRDNSGNPVCHATILGAATLDAEGNRTYNFPEIPDYKKGMLEKLESITPSNQFKSQTLMIPQPRTSGVELVNNKDFIFAYNDEKDVPDWITTRLPHTKEDIIDAGCVITSKDPSFSKLNKTWDSNCSKDTTITGSVLGDSLYVIDEHQLLGGDDMELYLPLRNQVEKNYSDIVVMDAVGPQRIFTQICHKRLMQDIGHDFVFKFHKKPKNDTSVGKAERAMFVLGEMFRMGRILVHWKLKRLIAEVERHTTGYDFLDTLIQICSYDFNILESVGKTRRLSNVYNMHNSRNVGYMEEVCSVTGY